MELLVGRGACRIPKGWEKSQNRIQVARAKGEGVKAAVVNQVILEGTNQIGMGVLFVLFVPGAGCDLLGRDLHVQLGMGVLPGGEEMAVRLPKR